MSDRPPRDFEVMHSKDRDTRAENIYQEVQFSIKAFALREATRWRVIWIAVGFIAIILASALIIAIQTNNNRRAQDRRLDVELQRIAHHNTARIRAIEIQSTLAKEQICSFSQKGQTCRALFDRLAHAISPEQRRQLACRVLGEFPTTPAVREIRRQIICPPLPP